MHLSEVFTGLGEDALDQLLKGVSMGKLKTFQLFERVKTRAHLGKLNTATLRGAGPRLMQRMAGGDEELATELSQAILICHFDMIVAVLNFLGIPHEEGFFVKDLDPAKYLTEGWQERVYAEFQGKFPNALLLFYINHLAVELLKADTVFAPAA
jgi:hypothetical protein